MLRVSNPDSFWVLIVLLWIMIFVIRGVKKLSRGKYIA